jgi:hypothetical protein
MSTNSRPTGFARDPALWGILVAQIGLCLPGLFSRSLWLDEAYSAVLARKSFTEIRSSLLRDSGPPLYYGSPQHQMGNLS